MGAYVIVSTGSCGAGFAAAAFSLAALYAAPLRAAPEAPASCPSVETLAGSPATPGEWQARVETSRKNYAAFACRAMLALAQRNAERARLRQSDGRIEDFVADDTLQPGDVVVTDQGFRVFNGAGNARAAGDFKPVDGAAVPPRLRRSLGEMEKASGFRRNAPPP